LSSSSASENLSGIDKTNLPTHIAIIMDGNGRWAKQRLLNRVKGHEKGSDTVRTIVRTCRELGIPYLTLYAFSTENWQRPKVEVDALMMLLKKFLTSEQKEMVDNDIRLNVIGQIERLPKDVQKALDRTMTATMGNRALQLNLALSYGGRAELVRMVQNIVADVQDGKLAPETINEDVISDFLYTRGIPDPDLLIRTSGEMRISNFLLWQLAYTEIYVTPTFWPEFNKAELVAILKDFQGRERRYGKV